MKVLMLTPYLPFPLMSGGQTRSFNLIKNLSSKHEITLFSLIKSDEEKKYVPELAKYCKKVEVFKRPKTPWNLRNVLLTGFGLYPFLVIRNLASAERAAVARELKSENYDLIHAETFYVMPHIPKTDIPTLLVEQTIEYLVYKHYVEDQALFFLRPLLWIDVAKLKPWETYYWKHATKVVAMSDSDKSEMRKLSPRLPIDIVPNGIDVAYFSQKKKVQNKSPKVLYVGFFSWLQNVEAAEILAREVWPLIKAAIPGAKLWIVGKNITEHIRALASDDIEVTEGIADIRDAYSGADVLVAPIKGPGGTRLKILEAMASSLPVVTTAIGAEGLGIGDGQEAIVRNTLEELAEAAIAILKSKKLSEKLGKAGRVFVEKNYTWEKSAGLLDEIYEEVVSGK